jgi:serine/threonine protein kinase
MPPVESVRRLTFRQAARDFLIQCFQKDPNLRVTAKKLLKHNWIVGCRRSDAPVAKASGNFSQAVEEVKQWNKALDSDSHSHLRASTGSNPNEFLHPRSAAQRFAAPEQTTRLSTPAKGILSLAKPRPIAEEYLAPELDGKLNTGLNRLLLI